MNFTKPRICDEQGQAVITSHPGYVQVRHADGLYGSGHLGGHLMLVV